MGSDIPSQLYDRSSERFVLLTDHARERIAEMEVTVEEVAHAVLYPNTTYGGSDRSGRTQIRRRHDGRIAVVCPTDEDVVITVLWNTDDEYTRQENQ